MKGRTCMLSAVGLLLSAALCLRAQPRKLLIRQGHQAEINQVVYHPSGRYLFTAGEDGQVKKWDLYNGFAVSTYSVGRQGIRSLALSPDGHLIYAGDAAGHLIVWQVDKPAEPLREIQAHKGSLNVIRLMPGRLITGGDDATLRVWDANLQPLLTISEGIAGRVQSLALTPDGRRALLGGVRSNDWELLLVDLEQGSVLDDFFDHLSGMKAAKAASMIMLGAASVGSNIAKGKKDVLTVFRMRVSHIQFAADGRQAVVSLNTFVPVFETRGHEETVGGSSIWLPRLNADGTRFENPDNTGRWIMTFPRARAYFTPDYRQLLVNVRADVRLYDLGQAVFPADNKAARAYEPPLVRKFAADGEQLSTLAPAPDFRTLATVSRDGRLDLWDFRTGRYIRSLSGAVQPALAVEPLPDGRHIIVGSLHKNLAVWDIITGRLVRTFQRSYDVNHIDISPDGRYMVTTAAGTRFFKLWNLQSGNIISTCMEKDDPVVWVQFDEDPEYILAATTDSLVKRWSPAERKIKKKLKERVAAFDRRRQHGRKVIRLNGHRLRVDEGSTNLLTARQRSTITDAVFSPDGRLVFTTNMLGEIGVYDLQRGLLVNMVLVHDADYITYTPDFYYTASKGAAGALAFLENDRVLPFEQMELRYHRPDQVARELGADPALVESYHRAWQKRLRLSGFSESDLDTRLELPVLTIEDSLYPLATREETFTYRVLARGSKLPVTHIRVYVNGVPLFGLQGRPVVASGREVTEDITLTLSAGMNVITTVAVNSGGLESIPHELRINCDKGVASPALYLVAIGVSEYRDNRYNLQYAAKDARDIKALLERSQAFSAVHTLLLTDEEATFAGIIRAEHFLARAGVDDVVIFFLAGHGVLDEQYNYYFAAHDMDFAHPVRGGVPYEWLRSLLQQVAARKRLLIMDTCFSGEVDRDEVERITASAGRMPGIRFRSAGSVQVQYRERPFGWQNTLELARTLFGDIRQDTGATVIAAAGGTELAREGAGSANGLFTSCLLEGLQTRRADLNRDRRFYVSELKKYVTQRVAQLSGGLQVPTSREENIRYDFRVY